MKAHRAILARFLARLLSVATLLVLESRVAAPAEQSAVTPSATEVVLTVDPQASRVHWSVDSTMHTVHGTFDVKKGRLNFDSESGQAAGEVVVAATSGESGNHSRDSKMHNEILETAKYPDAVFHPTLIEGKIAPNGPCDVKLHGVLTVHGADHEITARIHAEFSGDRWIGTGSFDVPYVSWGIKDPSNFLLKVKHNVSVELNLAGAAVKVSKAAQN